MTKYRIGIDGTAADHGALVWVEGNIQPDVDRVEVTMSRGQQHAGTDGVRTGVLRSTAERLRQQHPRLTVTESGATSAVPVFEADVLVIGVGRASLISRALSGWMPERLTANSEIPVIAVPEHWEEHHSGSSIIVGVDADTSGAALQFAATRAAAEGSALTIVRAWQVPTVSTPYGYAYVEEDRAIWARQATELVEHFARVIRRQFPTLRVDTTVGEGRAGDVLAGLSATAALLVVGRRHHTVLGGALFGSVGQQLLRDSGIPVATVPPEASVRTNAVLDRGAEQAIQVDSGVMVSAR